MNILRLVLVFFLTLPFTSNVSASDITSSVRNGHIATPDSEYSTLEAGIGFGYFDNPYVRTQDIADGWFASPDISGEFRYKRFFAEASEGSQDGLNLGYTIWQNQKWSIDFLAASMIGRINIDLLDNDSEGSDETSRNKQLEEKHTFYLGTGLRLTRYINQYVIQYRLVSDTYQRNGPVSTLRIGRGWQVQNWHIGAILSAQYTSRDTNDYWYGVDANEATTLYPEFQADKSLSYSVLINATKPLSQRLVLRAYLGYSPLSSGVQKSPLLTEPDLKAAVLTLNYVFF